MLQAMCQQRKYGARILHSLCNLAGRTKHLSARMTNLWFLWSSLFSPGFLVVLMSLCVETKCEKRRNWARSVPKHLNIWNSIPHQWNGNWFPGECPQIFVVLLWFCSDFAQMFDFNANHIKMMDLDDGFPYFWNYFRIFFYVRLPLV